jgi:aryl-alcohol dehydrogenase-like predicted oxidoreductase
MTTRREWLASTTVLGAGLVFSGCRSKAHAPESRTAGPPPAAPPPSAAPAKAATEVPAGAAGQARATLSTRKIPSTGEEVPVIGAGTSGSYEVPLDSPEFAALGETIRVFFDGGGRVFDTSPNYSNAEDVLGELLARGRFRDRCFLATKLAADSQKELEAQWAASLRRLKTDKVELLQVHNLRNLGEALPYARELKQRGVVKYIGITHYLESGHAELVRVMKKEKLDFIQVNYSVSAPEAALGVFPAAQELGVAVMVNRAFDDGRLFTKVEGRALPGWAGELGVTSWAQMFLKFALSHPAVTVVIPATGKPNRQADNLRAGMGPLLDAAQQKELLASFA